MDFTIKKKLETDEYEKVIHFLKSLEYYCIEQHPDWNTTIEKYSHRFLVGTDTGGLVKCFGNIVLSNGPIKTASIKFGPAFSNFTVLAEAIKFLHTYFAAQKFSFFSIQLGTYINNQTEFLEYNINRIFKVKYIFKPENLWASVCVDLKRSEDELLQSFSKQHRSKIKNSCQKKNLRVCIENNPQYLKSFIDIFTKMMKTRNLPFDKDNTTQLFHKINNFLFEKDNGFIEYIFQGDTLVGGMIIIYQGDTARCYKSATDPERRDIPVIHFGTFEAMKLCKEKGFEKFDLWGYNHFVDENDQIFKINQFKRGFGGEFTFFPKRMNFELRPIGFRIYKSLKFYKKILYRGV